MSPPPRPTIVNEPAARAGDLVKRHRLSTRVWHWTNALVLLVMLMSGLMIFNAHPRLYWGSYGANNDRAWLAIGREGARGYVQIGSARVPTTGVLGVNSTNRAFPSWATIPSGYDLAGARKWHLAFAWLLAFGLLFYMIRSLWNRHIQRDLKLDRQDVSPRHVWADIKDHARLRFPTGPDALEYNSLQKFSYLGVIFVLLPLVIFTGLMMSPTMNAAWPWMLELFGGRQSARSLHFIATAGLVAFTIVHLIMVVLAGPYNEVRSMITGKFRLPKERPNA